MSNPLRILAVLLLVSGCGAGVPEAERTVRVDSAGVELAVHSAAVLDRVLDWDVEPEPLVVIGTESGEAHEEFFRIDGVAALGADRIAVLNAGTSEVRFFDMSGRYLSSVGRSGEGPGEFRFPRLLSTFGRDSLLLYDLGLRRFTTVTAEGGIRAYSGLPDRHRGNPVAATADGQVLTRRSSTSARPDSPEEVLTDTVRLGVIAKGSADGTADHADAGESVFAELPGQRVLRWKMDNMFGFLPVPFDIAPAAAAGPRGFFVLLGVVPEVRQYSADGDLVRIIRIAEAARPLERSVFAAHVDSIVEAAASDQRAELRRRYRLMDAPAAAPVFDRIRVGEHGDPWLRHAESADWFVMDSVGTALGRLALPPGFIVSQILDDLLLGYTRDEWGVERVQVHRLTPRSSNRGT